MIHRILPLLTVLLALFGGFSYAEEKKPETLEWDELVPSDFNPEHLFKKYDLDNMSDDDPRAAEFMAELKEIWKVAPVVDSMEGRFVKMPGFVVPLEMDGEEVREFFLVPYFGACIHVPPPPANQMIYVVMQKGSGLKGGLFQAIWVTGNLSIKRTSTDLGDAGYMMYATATEPYEEE